MTDECSRAAIIGMRTLSLSIRVPRRTSAVVVFVLRGTDSGKTRVVKHRIPLEAPRGTKRRRKHKHGPTEPPIEPPFEPPQHSLPEREPDTIIDDAMQVEAYAVNFGADGVYDDGTVRYEVHGDRVLIWIET